MVSYHLGKSYVSKTISEQQSKQIVNILPVASISDKPSLVGSLQLAHFFIFVCTPQVPQIQRLTILSEFVLVSPLICLHILYSYFCCVCVLWVCVWQNIITNMEIFSLSWCDCYVFNLVEC